MHRPASERDRRAALGELVALHRRVDEQAAAIAARHGERLRCRLGCTACCIDGITVFAVEAARIREGHEDLLARAEAHPPGACAFLAADGACRIYADRPYVCRTQGLPLRWHEPDAHGRAAEHRDICPENEPGPPLAGLPEAECWTIGPSESLLAGIARRYDPEARRLPLRSLFRRAEPLDGPG